MTRILLRINLLTVVLIVPGAVKVVEISLFQSSTLLLIRLSNSLVKIFLLMVPLFGMLFLMRFMHPSP